MKKIMGVDLRCEIFKSSKGRKFYYTVTYFDLIDGIKTKRKYPNVVSEYFTRKKDLISDDFYLKCKNRLL